jgi:hypothetical protein
MDVMNLTGSGFGSVAGFGEHDNEPTGSIKGGRLHHQVSNYQFLKDYPLEFVSPVVVTQMDGSFYSRAAIKGTKLHMKSAFVFLVPFKV